MRSKNVHLIMVGAFSSLLVFPSRSLVQQIRQTSYPADHPWDSGQGRLMKEEWGTWTRYALDTRSSYCSSLQSSSKCSPNWCYCPKVRRHELPFPPCFVIWKSSCCRGQQYLQHLMGRDMCFGNCEVPKFHQLSERWTNKNMISPGGRLMFL